MVILYKIEVYTKKNCPYCNKVKDFFIKKSLSFTEILIDDSLSKAKYLEMCARSKGRTTVPQIFINNYHVGGSDDLMKLLKNSEKFDILLYNKEYKV